MDVADERQPDVAQEAVILGAVEEVDSPAGPQVVYIVIDGLTFGPKVWRRGEVIPVDSLPPALKEDLERGDYRKVAPVVPSTLEPKPGPTVIRDNGITYVMHSNVEVPEIVSQPGVQPVVLKHK